VRVSQYTPPAIDTSASNGKYLSTEVTVSTYPVETQSTSGITTSFAMSETAATDPEVQSASDAELLDVLDEVPSDTVYEAPNTGDEHPFFDFVQGLSEDERTAMRDFHHQMIEAVKSGADEADIAALAAKAPAPLQEFAASQGISVDEFIQKEVERIENRPPPTALQQEMHEFFKSQDLDPKESGLGDFFRQLMEASKNNEDVSSLADSAPQALSEFADHKGITISELLGQIEVDIEAQHSA